MKDNNLLQVSLKWGGILAGISAITFIGNYAFGAGANTTVAMIVGIISLIINVIILVMSNQEYRNKYLGGYIKYGQCFLNSLLLMMFSSIVISLLTFLVYGVIDTESFTNMIDSQLIAISSNTGMPEQFKQSQMDALISMTPLKQSAYQLLGNTIWGLVLALIVSAFTRKKNNTFEGITKDIE